MPPTANRINVVRGDIIESPFRAFRTRQFNPNCKLDVVFFAHVVKVKEQWTMVDPPGNF